MFTVPCRASSSAPITDTDSAIRYAKTASEPHCKPENQAMRCLGVILCCCLSLSAVAAAPENLSSDKPLSPKTWEHLRERLALLNNISYLPTLLPIIMAHRNELELTEAQVAALREWRRDHYQNMVDTMNVIIRKRIALSQGALQPEASAEALIAMQDEIFILQRKLFELRLSCRELVTSTFTEDQWSNFAFIAAEDPQIGGLIE